MSTKIQRVPASKLHVDAKIGQFTVDTVAFIRDGQPRTDPHVVLVKMSCVDPGTNDKVQVSTWFFGMEEVDIIPSPHHHSEDDNVDDNIRDKL